MNNLVHTAPWLTKAHFEAFCFLFFGRFEWLRQLVEVASEWQLLLVGQSDALSPTSAWYFSETGRTRSASAKGIRTVCVI